MAAGSATWGALASRTGIHAALLWAGAGTMVSSLTGLFLKLPDATVDLTPWIHWRMPTILKEDPAAADAGPVLVTVEYSVDPEKVPGFLTAINKYERIRRRDGAYQWGVFRDLEDGHRYLEIFLVDSWAEHARQHERSTRADRALEQEVKSYIRGESTVRHLVAAIEG
jgi:quinol monooxygenase YgiN